MDLAMMDHKDWNKVWIIGASTGIGRELALQMAPLCNAVYASARSADKLEALVGAHANIIAKPLDVSDVEKVRAVASQIETDETPCDLVVVCSGVWEQTKIPEFDPQVFAKTMNVNYLGAVNIISAVAPGMSANRKGHIAIVASVAGYRGLPNAAAYAPTKAALINLAECIKPQLGKMGVRVSIVNPGFVETRLTAVNEFPMPFIQSAQEAAEKIINGLESKRYEIAFPWQLVGILKFLRILPNRLFFWLIDRFVLR